MGLCEYTEDGEKLLEKYRKLMRHALRMNNKKMYIRHGEKFYKAYRNYLTKHERARLSILGKWIDFVFFVSLKAAIWAAIYVYIVFGLASFIDSFFM